MTSQFESAPVKLNPDDVVDEQFRVFVDLVREDSTDLLVAADQKRLIEDMRQPNSAAVDVARHDLVTSHLGLVAAVAFEYRLTTGDDTRTSEELMEQGKQVY